jgi:hypothetical protein
MGAHRSRQVIGMMVADAVEHLDAHAEEARCFPTADVRLAAAERFLVGSNTSKATGPRHGGYRDHKIPSKPTAAEIWRMISRRALG